MPRFDATPSRVRAGSERAYTAAMDSASLTTAQLNELAERANHARRFYTSLVRRMEERGFPAEDPLYRLTKKTAEQVNDLWLDLHYRSCSISGVAPKE
jgi:hypothetical protein